MLESRKNSQGEQFGKVTIISAGEPESRSVAQASEILLNGGVVALPTETVYGLAAHIDRREALECIFALKQRPLSDPLIVHIFDASWIETIAEPNVFQSLAAKALAEAFWPGPLTIVLESLPEVDSIIRAGGPTVALRSPSHPFFRAVLSRVGTGIAAPSANVFGHISPTKAADVASEFEGHELMVFDGGACQVGIESTVLRLERDGVVSILRPGVITADQVREALRRAEVDSVVKEHVARGKGSVDLGEPQAAPGQAVRHYAPDVPAFVLKVGDQVAPSQPSGPFGCTELVVAVEDGELALSLDEVVLVGFGVLEAPLSELAGAVARYINPSPQGDLEEYTRNLFGALREAEAVPGAKTILIHFECPQDDLWSDAIRDRITRSASGRWARWVGLK